MEPAGGAKLRQLNDGIHRNGQQQEGARPAQQPPVGALAPERQQHPEHGVQRQDVPAPEEPQVDQADRKQAQHPAVEDLQPLAALGERMLQDDGEPDPEEQGEDRIELPVHEEGQQVAQRPVQTRGLQGGGILRG